MPPVARPLLLLLFALALAAACWRIPAVTPSAFTLPEAAPSSLPAEFSAVMLTGDDTTASQPTLTQLPDGRLAAAWLSSRDDEPVIRFSVFGRDGWREPQIIASRPSTAGGSFAHVGELDRPILHAEGSWLHLWYISRAAGGSINHSLSTDSGKTWTKPTRLQSSPLANQGSELAAPPLPLADGGLLLPASQNLLGRRGEILHLSPTGRIIDKTRLPAGPAWQPALLALDAQRALGLLRVEGGIQAVGTDDGGRRWQRREAVPTPHPDLPFAALRLKSGRLLLAGNGSAGRQSLQLWLSADDGQHWEASRTVEAAVDGGAEFTAPALLLGRDGHIHLVYGWRRQGIRHASFSEAWLDGGRQ